MKSSSSSVYGPPARAAKLPLIPDPLDEKEHLFVDELMIDADPQKAAIRAGLSARMGTSLMSKPHIQAAISTARRLRAARVRVPQDYVLRRWLDIEQADPREIVEHWKVPCRNCWGIDHHSQYNDHEWEQYAAKRRAQRRYLEIKARDMDEAERESWINLELGDEERGGPGYTVLKDPMRGPDFVEFWAQHAARLDKIMPAWAASNSDHTCPACYGLGIPFIVFHDTRTLSPAAAALYCGVKQSKDSFEIQLRDQDEIRTLLAKHLNYFVERKVVLVAGVEQLSEQELIEKRKILDAEYAELVESAAANGLADGNLLEGDSERGVSA